MSAPILKEDDFVILDDWLDVLRTFEEWGSIQKLYMPGIVEKIQILYELKDSEITDFIRLNIPESVRQALENKEK